ncbi:MAG: ribosome-associated translation inhibitor RaiA [Bacteroidaceae bacterium]|nr:ribosome-associated translation inhibitor RaiA [Bacteroidaceae bacterium]
MEIRIQALHFNATEQLRSFIEKKCLKMDRVHDAISKVDVVLEVVKPEVSLNKQARISVTIQGGEVYAEKTCDTFEQAVDDCVEALERQLQKTKEKQREK